MPQYRLTKQFFITVFAILASFALSTLTVSAQTDVLGKKSRGYADQIKKLWRNSMREKQQELDAANTEERGALYEKMASQVMSDPLVKQFFDARWEETDGFHAAVQEVASEIGESKTAKTFNNASTNFSATSLLERSGFTDFLAIMLDSKNLVSTSESAVTINLNALALLGTSSGAYSSFTDYNKNENLRRLGGSVTFGARIPEKEIVGFSGFPDAENLLDAFSWDVKYRVFGDRDPRASRWNRLLIGDVGQTALLAAELVSGKMVSDADLPLFQRALVGVLGAQYKRAKQEYENSFQASIKASGLHLTKEEGRNRYTFDFIGDKGFGAADLTFKMGYSAIQDVPMMMEGESTPATMPMVPAPPIMSFTLEEWKVSAGLTGTIWQNAIVAGRGSEVSVAAQAMIPTDGSDVPLDRKTRWQTNFGISFPISGSVKIPVSVIYTNDDNALMKQNYVEGRIGISYDFGSLASLFKPSDNDDAR